MADEALQIKLPILVEATLIMESGDIQVVVGNPEQKRRTKEAMRRLKT